MSDPWSLKIADFLIQALELSDDRSELAGAVVALKRDEATGISAIELDSSIGSTPFLVYHYVLSHSRDRLNEDLATLEKAANLNSPGPRIVAHAETSDEAYILATTPSIQRALSGAVKPVEAKSPMAIEQARSRIPDRLGDKLRECNKLAGDWLAAIRQIREAGDERIELTEQEAALALYLLDEDSIQDLLTALNILMNAARHSAADSLM